jgi:signal transduction histidine kinase
VPWADSNPTDRILMHLAEIGAGRCTITDDIIVAEADPDMGQVLLGLLVLHEDLTYASQQRTAAETMLRGIAEERERLLEDRRQGVEARDQFLAIAAHELRTPLATLALLVDHLMATLVPAYGLLSNALKYGAGRPVELSVRGEAARALLVVRDHGVGIPEDEQARVFGPFARATTARYHPGLGLGLWIAQQIVQASAGRISLESRVEEGSTFTVELPR